MLLYSRRHPRAVPTHLPSCLGLYTVELCYFQSKNPNPAKCKKKHQAAFAYLWPQHNLCSLPLIFYLLPSAAAILSYINKCKHRTSAKLKQPESMPRNRSKRRQSLTWEHSYHSANHVLAAAGQDMHEVVHQMS